MKKTLRKAFEKDAKLSITLGYVNNWNYITVDKVKDHYEINEGYSYIIREKDSNSKTLTCNFEELCLFLKENMADYFLLNNIGKQVFFNGVRH